MPVDDDQIKSWLATDGAHPDRFIQALGGALEVRPRCGWAGPAGWRDTDVVIWDEYRYRRRWIWPETQVWAQTWLEEGAESLELILEVGGLYAEGGLDSSTSGHEDQYDSPAVRGGVVVDVQVAQRRAGGLVWIVGDPVQGPYSEAHTLDYHYTSWRARSTPGLHHAEKALVVDAGGKGSLPIREGMTRPTFDDAWPRRVAVQVDGLGDVDTDHPVTVGFEARAYTDSDSGLEASRPEWGEDVGPTDFFHEDPNIDPQESAMWPIILGASIWSGGAI